jgi:hypothetical protein
MMDYAPCIGGQGRLKIGRETLSVLVSRPPLPLQAFDGTSHLTISSHLTIEIDEIDSD